MNIVKTEIEGPLIIEPQVFEDERGYFFESYSKLVLEKFGVIAEFIQDNESKSKKGVLRGLHFQNPPFEQGKLIRVVKGAVMDVAVDIRKKSAFYGKYIAVELNEKNKKTLWIPPGFAHGFLTLRDDTVFYYKCTNIYNKNSERTILWNDSDLGIKWVVNNPVISEKDKHGLPFRDFVSNF